MLGERRAVLQGRTGRNGHWSVSNSGRICLCMVAVHSSVGAVNTQMMEHKHRTGGGRVHRSAGTWDLEFAWGWEAGFLCAAYLVAADRRCLFAASFSSRYTLLRHGDFGES